MSSKRGFEDISVEAQISPKSEESTPKRSKLDFLAMIAELSEQKNDASKMSPLAVAAALPAQPPAQPVEQPIKSDPPSPSKNSVSPKKTDGPKSSFAAWKLAKGRKNSSKPSMTGSSAAEATDNVSEKSPPPAASMDNPLVAMAAAASLLPVATKMPSYEVEPTVAVPPKKATKKDSSSTKKIVSPKKAGVSLKKDKDAVSSKKKSKGKSKKGDQSGVKAPTFPEKVMDLLQTGPTLRAIYWLPEGEAIAVDPDKFKDNPIISKQFRGNKLSSFVRSLNRWGFRRIFYHSLPDKTLAFYHSLFQKNQPALIKEMKMDAGEQELHLPPGAMATAPISTPDGDAPVVPAPAAEAMPKKPESAGSALGGGGSSAGPEVASAVAVNPPLPVLPEKVPPSPAIAAPAPAAFEIVQAAIQAAALPVRAPAPPALPVEPVASAPIPAAVPSHNALERTALELAAENQHALQLQQAMAAEQERSDLAMQSLQAQQLVLQSLVDQQNVAQAEELLMQSMIAEQQRSELALQQRQAEQALLQQMLAEQETAALTAALGGAAGAGAGLSAEALLRERLLLQQLAATPAPAPGGSDVLALLQQQLQGGQQQPQARSERSYLEQLVLLEQQQQQQQQRQQEAALLAAHGFRFG